jgi:hypothetical protein
VVGRLGLAMDLHSSQESLHRRDVRCRRFGSRQYYHNSSLSRFEHLVVVLRLSGTHVHAHSGTFPVLARAAILGDVANFF